MMHRNRQASLIFLILFFSTMMTAQTQYGSIAQLPDFENAIPIADILVSDLDNHYSYLPEGQYWMGKKLENWNEFFAAGEKVEVRFFYQKTLSSQLINETQLPISKTEPWYFKVQYIGYFYVVLQGRDCKVVLKYWRNENGICQYQSFDCDT